MKKRYLKPGLLVTVVVTTDTMEAISIDPGEDVDQSDKAKGTGHNGFSINWEEEEEGI